MRKTIISIAQFIESVSLWTHAIFLSMGFAHMSRDHFKNSCWMSSILECKNVHRHKERNKVLNSLASQWGNMKTTHLSIYTLRDLWLQGMVSVHSHEEVSLPLNNPVQFMETCVTVDMEGWAGPVNPGTCSTFVYSCNTADQWKYIKECKYSTGRRLSMFLCVCVYCPKSIWPDTLLIYDENNDFWEWQYNWHLGLLYFVPWKRKAKKMSHIVGVVYR